MKVRKTLIPMLVAIGIIALFAACQKTADQKLADAQVNQVEATQDVRDAAATSVAVNDWESFKANANNQIATNDRIIADYKQMMTDTNGKWKATYNKEIEALEKTNRDWKVKLDSYKDDGKNNWDKFKNEFDQDMSKLDNSLKGFVEKK